MTPFDLLPILAPALVPGEGPCRGPLLGRFMNLKRRLIRVKATRWSNAVRRHILGHLLQGISDTPVTFGPPLVAAGAA